MSSKRGYNIILNAAEYCLKCGGYDIITKPAITSNGVPIKMEEIIPQSYARVLTTSPICFFKDLKKVIEQRLHHSFAEKHLLRVVNPSQFNVTGGGEGRCIGEFTVAKEHLNPYLGLHGGYTATLIDNVTTYALMSTNAHPGVSVDMFINYMKSAKEGDVIIVDANTMKVGSKFAFMECVLRNKSDGSLIAKGGQTKYIDLPKGKLSVLYE